MHRSLVKIPCCSFSWEEVETWSRMESPRVLQLYGAVREGPNVILFMDLKRGDCFYQWKQVKSYLTQSLLSVQVLWLSCWEWRVVCLKSWLCIIILRSCRLSSTCTADASYTWMSKVSGTASGMDCHHKKITDWKKIVMYMFKEF